MGYWGNNGKLWGDQPADELDSAVEEAFGDFESYFGKITVEEASDNDIVADGLVRAAEVFKRDVGRPPTEAELIGGLAFSIGADGATSLLDTIIDDVQGGEAS